MITVITKEWVFTAAQTDLLLETVGATQRGVGKYVQVTCSKDNSIPVPVRIGWATATLPTVTPNSATGGAGMLLSHPGIAAGGGAIGSNGGAPIAIGATGADLRITLGVSTGGATHIIVAYHLDEEQ